MAWMMPGGSPIRPDAQSSIAHYEFDIVTAYVIVQVIFMASSPNLCASEHFPKHTTHCRYYVDNRQHLSTAPTTLTSLSTQTWQVAIDVLPNSKHTIDVITDAIQNTLLIFIIYATEFVQLDARYPKVKSYYESYPIPTAGNKHFR